MALAEATGEVGGADALAVAAGKPILLTLTLWLVHATSLGTHDDFPITRTVTISPSRKFMCRSLPVRSTLGTMRPEHAFTHCTYGSLQPKVVRSSIVGSLAGVPPAEAAAAMNQNGKIAATTSVQGSALQRFMCPLRHRSHRQYPNRSARLP